MVAGIVRGPQIDEAVTTAFSDGDNMVNSEIDVVVDDLAA